MANNIHDAHCCAVHGCLYGDDDCPIVTRTQEQSSHCEACHGIKDVDDEKDKRITDLETELTSARAEIARLRDALRQVQWGNEWFDEHSGENGTLYTHCPLCDQSEERGHAPDCLVGMCLESTTG